MSNEILQLLEEATQKLVEFEDLVSNQWSTDTLHLAWSYLQETLENLQNRLDRLAKSTSLAPGIQTESDGLEHKLYLRKAEFHQALQSVEKKLSELESR